MIFHLYIGTNKYTLADMMNGNFNKITFLSDNLETAAHYSEGAIGVVTVDLDMNSMMSYTRSDSVDDNYTWGYAEMNCPKDANWFSVSSSYFKSHEYRVTKMPDELSKAISDFYREDD